MKMHAIAVALMWAGVLTAQGQGPVQAGAKRPMTFADLMAMKRVSDPQISPSGKWVLFSVTDVSLEKNTKVNHLWVVPLGSSGSTNTGILRSAQNDKQEKQAEDTQERQVTFGTGESFGRFSPDGRSVSYTSEDQIHIANWNEAQGRLGKGDLTIERQVTDVAGGADGAIWSPDSKRLLFVAEVYPECSNMATWAEENECDRAKDEAAEKSPVKGEVWDALLYRHWDHYTGAKRSHVLVVDLQPDMPVAATQADPMKRTLADKASFSKALSTRVRDLTPASAVGDAETPTFFVGGAQNYAWAPDSTEIAYVTNLDPVPAASTNNDVFTLRLDEPGAKAVKVSTSPGSDDEPEYSPDGKWLAFRSQARGGFESDKFRLMVMDRGTKAIKDYMPKFDGWVDEFVWVHNPDAFNQDELYVTGGSEGTEPIFIALNRPDAGKNEKVQAHSGPGEYSDLSVGPKGNFIVAVRMFLDRPSEIYMRPVGACDFPEIACIFGAEPGTSPWVTHLNTSLLSQLDLHPIEPFWFEGAEGTKVEGFILRPPGFDPAKKYPVKFIMHGGPQTAMGDGWSYRWNWELMAANGYVVVGINRRGSTGYGQKFVDEVSGDWGGRAYVDLMKGLDYAETKFQFIDKTRECALGASYGGFMADWVLTHTNRFQCIVTHDGMYDPASAYGATEEMWFNEWEFRRPEDFPKGWDGFSAGYDPMGRANPTHRDTAAMNGAPGGGDDTKATTEILTGGQNDERSGAGHPAEPWRYQNLPADQDPFRKWSPMRFIQNAKTPTLVIHSQRDYRLDVSQGFELFTALQRLGVPSKMMYFPDEGHWVLKPQNSQMWNEVVSDWCDRWTKTGKYAEKQ